MDMCKIRCKIVNSQLIVFKKKKRKKKLIYESIHTDSKTKFTKITDGKWIRKARRNILGKVPARSDDIGQISLRYLHNRPALMSVVTE